MKWLPVWCGSSLKIKKLGRKDIGDCACHHSTIDGERDREEAEWEDRKQQKEA